MKRVDHILLMLLGMQLVLFSILVMLVKIYDKMPS